MTDYLTTSGVADLLHVSPETVRLYARQGRVPFESTPGGHRRYQRDLVLDALGREGSRAVSVDPSSLATISAGATQVNFDAQAITTPMAIEAAALASQLRPEPPSLPSGNANRVHAALMTWAAPVELRAGASR